jgi:apolipoprotein N-acyltransferase
LSRLAFVAAFLLGAATVFGFAPYGLWAVPMLTLALLFLLWQDATPRHASWLGFAFGCGLFLAGVGWVFVPLHDYGGMPWLLAAFATAVFCATLALFPALAGWLSATIRATALIQLTLVAPAAWALAEWARGWAFTGFPWLALGYAQVPDGPLMGYAPLAGVYGLSLASAIAAGCIAGLIATADTGNAPRWLLIATLIALATTGKGLSRVEWSTVEGKPLTVSLLQGNIAQELKFDARHFLDTLRTYVDLAEASRARLIVLPESALAAVIDDVPQSFLAQLEARARANGGDVLVGAFGIDPVRGEYHNSVFSLGVSPPQVYEKIHLVPFGESIPLKPVFGWILDRWLHIPLDDQGRGSLLQEPLNVAGQQVAVNICYEDAFGEELIRSLPAANLLVNVTNDAWYGHSAAAQQHGQMAQMRAAETARVMLRATNTGATSVIDEKGRTLAALPEFTTARLDATVEGRVGTTPYVRWGNAPAIVIAVLGLAAGWRSRRRDGAAGSRS